MKTYIFLSILVLLSGCTDKKIDTASLYNQEASLPDTLSFNPLEWKVICSSLNKNDKTMSTLYGNDMAVKSARKGVAYPAGSVIALVTWSQKEDVHWFGARIPGAVQSIEQVKFNAPAHDFSIPGKDSSLPFYERYEGSPLRISVAGNPSIIKSRIAYLAGQKASVVP
jgi:hypothetical protein